jgi:hypothetical protein
MVVRPDDTGLPFSTVRKGFDPDQVRARLRSLDAELVALRTKLAETETALEAARATPPTIDDLDDASVAARLGDETARVLTTARQGAVEMRARAADDAARILEDANAEASRVRLDAQIDADRVRADSENIAANHLESVKHQGREMLMDAHGVRERVLADLARRREAGRRQLEQLAAGRDRLVASHEMVRRSLDEVTEELARSVPEAEELAEGALARPLSEAQWPAPELAAPAATADAIATGGGIASSVASEPVASDATSNDVWATTGDVTSLVKAFDATTSVESVVSDEAASASDRAELQHPEMQHDDVLHDDVLHDDSPVDDLFARLRAARVDTPEWTPVTSSASVIDLADDGSEVESVRVVSDAATSPLLAPLEAAVPANPSAATLLDTSRLERREAEVAPLAVTLARHLKRAMVDEQNEVLDRLRRSSSRLVADNVFGTEIDHLERYRSAAQADLRSAAVAGARSGGTSPLEAAAVIEADGVVTTALDEVALEIARPLRAALVTCLFDAGHDIDAATNKLRATYREWKTQRFDDLSAHVVLGAYERGILATAPVGGCLRWVVDPGGPPCSDAEDNALAGEIPVGTSFPTGHMTPPAHVGCRCHLVVG